MSGRRSRRTRGEKPELVPPKSDEEPEDNDTDEKETAVSTTRGRGRRGKRVGSSSSLSQLATASKKSTGRKKAPAKAAAETTKKKRGRPRGRPRAKSPSPSESSISASEEEQEDEENASENEASDSNEASDAEDSNNEGSEEDEDDEDNDDAERDTEDDAPKEALTGKKKSTRKPRKKKGQEDAAASHPRYKNVVKIECRNCGKLCFSQGIKIHEKSCMPVYTPRPPEDSKSDEAKPKKQQQRRKKDEESDNSSNESQRSSTGNDGNNSDSSDDSSSPPSPVVMARKNTRFCKHCGNMVSSRGFMQHQRSCMKKAMERDDDDDENGSSNDEEMEAKSDDGSQSSSAAEESPPKKKRGRKPKAKAAADASSSGDEEDPPKKKRGRKATSKAATSGDDAESSSQSEKRPKKRGRPPKAKPDDDSGDEDESSSAAEDPPKKRGRTPRSKQGDDSLATVGEKPQTKRGRKPKGKSSASDKPAEASDEEGSDGFSKEDLLPISALATKRTPAKAGPTTTKGQQKKTPKNSKLSKAAAKAKTAPITNFFSPKASGSAKDPAQPIGKSDEDDNDEKEPAIAEDGAKSVDETSDIEKTGKTTGDTKDSSESVGEKTGQKNADIDEATATETSKASAENAAEESIETSMDIEENSTRPTRKRKLTMKAAEAAATEPPKTEEKSESDVAESKKVSESEVVEESRSENGSEASAEGEEQDATDLSKDPKSSASIVEAAKNAAAATLAMFPLFAAKSKSTEEGEKMELDSEDNEPDSKSKPSASKEDTQDGATETNKLAEASATITDDAILDKDKGSASSTEQPLPSTELQSNEQSTGKESDQTPPNATAGTGDVTKSTNDPMEIDSTGEENGDKMDVEMPASSSDKANGDSIKETESPAIGPDSDVKNSIPDASTEKIIASAEANSINGKENPTNHESSSIKTNGDIAGNDKSHAEKEKAIDGNQLEKETAQSSPDTETKNSATTDEVGESSSVTVEEKAAIPQDGERRVATEGGIIGATNSEVDPKQSETGEKEEIDSSLEEKPTATDQTVSAQTKLEASPKETSSDKATSHDIVEKATDSQSIEQSDSGKLNQEGVAESSGNNDRSDNTKAENGNAEHSEPIKPETVTDKTVSTIENQGTSQTPIATTSSDDANLENERNDSDEKEPKTMSHKDMEESNEKANSSPPLKADDALEAGQTDACKDSSSMTESGEKKSTTEGVEMEIDAPPSSSIATPAAETTQMEVDDPKECSPELANEETKSKKTEEVDAEKEATSVGENALPEEHDTTMQIDIPNEALSEPETDMPSPKVEMKLCWVSLSNALRQAKSSKDNHQFVGCDESKTNRVKMLLYTTGSKVHRGRGFERIFGMYWDAVCLRLSRPLNGNASKCCDEAITAFLKSKKLRKIHNKFVMSIMRRALKDRVRYSEVSENIPSRWHNRVKVPHVTVSKKPKKKKLKTFYNGLEEDLLQLSSVPHIDGTTPYREQWECPTDAIDEIYKNPQEGPSVPIASSCIPGALVVDPMLRETVEAGGMKVTDNAMWFLTVALKEHIKNILGDSIEYKKGLEKGEIFSHAIRYPNVLAATSTSKKRIARGRTAPSSPENGRKQQINSIDLFAALNMLPSGQPSAIGGSFSRMSLEQTFLCGFNSIPSFDTGMGFNDVQGFISNTITEMAKTRKPEEKKAKATSNTKSTENSTTKDRQTSAKGQREGAPKTPNASPMANLESPPLTSDKSPADAQTPLVDSPLAKTNDMGSASEKKNEEASSGVISNSRGDESRASGASDIQVVKVEKPAQQLTAGGNAPHPGPLKSGAGRGAKNLAALMARATESTTTGGSNDSSQGEEKPNTASTDATANSEPPKPSAEIPTNELPKAPVESKPSDGTNPQSSAGAVGDNQSQPNPSAQTTAPVRRGSGKGFGSKDLAAMRARSITSTQPTEGETAPKPPEN